jgi:hypothetical protein
MATVLSFVGALIAVGFGGDPGPQHLPPYALDSVALFYIVRTGVFLVALLVIVSVLAHGLSGRLPSKFGASGIGVEWETRTEDALRQGHTAIDAVDDRVTELAGDVRRELDEIKHILTDTTNTVALIAERQRGRAAWRRSFRR